MPSDQYTNRRHGLDQSPGRVAFRNVVDIEPIPVDCRSLWYAGDIGDISGRSQC